MLTEIELELTRGDSLVQWKLLSDDVARDVWDQYLVKFDDVTYFQTYAWGEHRRSFGWTPLRWVAYDDSGEIVSVVQGLYKPLKLGVGQLWSSGGPIGDLSTWDEKMRKVIVKTTGAKQLYYRFFSNRKATETDQAALKTLGWKRCTYKLRSGMSMRLCLDKDVEQIRKDFSRNWRRNLDRSNKSNLTISEWKAPNVNDMVAVYRQMETYKGIEEQFSRDELEGIFQNLGDRITLYKCDDENGQLIAFRGCAILDRFGWDLFAASNVEARNLYASYALMWAVLQHSRHEGVKEYDLMGIDPANNPGVANFKKGTGAESIEYLGEWDWATNKALRWSANLAVRYRRSNA